MIPEANIKNFTTDWNNGRALSALVDTCIPGAISDWNLLDENNAVENITTAMQVVGHSVDSVSVQLFPKSLNLVLMFLNGAGCVISLLRFLSYAIFFR